MSHVPAAAGEGLWHMHTGQIGVRLQAHQSPTPWCSQGTMCGTTMLAPSLIQRCTKPLCIRMNSCTGYQKTLVPCDLGRICVPLWALPPKRDMLRSGLTHCCCQPSCLASGTKGGETDCLLCAVCPDRKRPEEGAEVTLGALWSIAELGARSGRLQCQRLGMLAKLLCTNRSQQMLLISYIICKELFLLQEQLGFGFCLFCSSSYPPHCSPTPPLADTGNVFP